MSELPAGVNAELFEDLSFALAGVGLCHVIGRSSEVWELLELVRAERSMVRGEIYRYNGLGEGYRAGGIAHTIVKKLDAISHRLGEIVRKLREVLAKVPDIPHDAETTEFVISFVTMSAKGREAVTRWVAAPDESIPDVSEKVRAILGMVQGYQKALRRFRPSPQPISSPLDTTVREQTGPKYESIEIPEEVSLIPAPPAGVPAAVPAPAPAPEPEPAPPLFKPPTPVPVAAPPPPVAAPPAPAEAAVPVSLILPRGVNPEILEEVRRVEQCRKVFEETHQTIEVWEVFCLVMMDSDETKKSLGTLLELKRRSERQGFNEGALQLFDRLLKLRAQHGKFVRDLRGFLGSLPIGTFGKETTEMALGFIVASGRGRERAQTWLSEPDRYKVEAAGRLEDLISRTMNYQTALRMLPATV